MERHTYDPHLGFTQHRRFVAEVVVQWMRVDSGGMEALHVQK
jgi:hypothetical protein